MPVHVMRIATGEIEDTSLDDGKDPAAKALGKKGGSARTKNMTSERRKQIARNAASKRWLTYEPPFCCHAHQIPLETLRGASVCSVSRSPDARPPWLCYDGPCSNAAPAIRHLSNPLFPAAAARQCGAWTPPKSHR